MYMCKDFVCAIPDTCWYWYCKAESVEECKYQSPCYVCVKHDSCDYGAKIFDSKENTIIE